MLLRIVGNGIISMYGWCGKDPCSEVGIKGSGTDINGEMWNPCWPLQDSLSSFEIATKAERAFTPCVSSISEDPIRLNSEISGDWPSVRICCSTLVILSGTGWPRRTGQT